MFRIMRTTLNLDDDVLEAARALSEQRGQSIGAVVSDLIRQSLAPQTSEEIRNGIRLFPARPDEPPITPELVKRLLEETE
jgi:hypothetical protein